MKNKIISSTLLLLGFFLGATALSTLAATWTPPDCNPSTNPGACNTEAPLHVGSVSQSKDGPLLVNTASVLDDVGLTIAGKIKLDFIRKGEGKVLTSDADGVGTWMSPSQGTELSCAAPAPGWYDVARCCKVNMQNGEVMCKEYQAGVWQKHTTPFPATTAGSYSIDVDDVRPGYIGVRLCRYDNKTGATQCRIATAYSGWSIETWGNVINIPIF
jgi:hypothetical protein